MKLVKRQGLILAGLLILLALEIVWAVGYLGIFKIDKGVKISPETGPEKTVSLSLSPAEGEFAAGQEFGAAILLSTNQKKIIGADAILKFDPGKLEVLEILPGDIFNLYPQEKIEEGKILISAVLENKKDFSGQGILAKLRIKGKTVGKANLNFEFTPGRTDDSNIAIAGTGKDVLEKTVSGVYTFK